MEAMGVEQPGVVVVCGATGRQGGAVTRHLLAAGWRVRALTRQPESAKARALGALGAEVIKADMAVRAEMDRALADAYGVFSVQNPMISGFEGEMTQGRTVADAAHAAGVRHLVYGAAGIGERTGIPSWDTKVTIEAHMRGLGLPLTILRPNAFMELMTDKAYYPPIAIWHVMPKLMGGGRPVPWLAVDDLGAIAARVFADRARFVGADLPLAADVQSMDEARSTWQDVTGRPPRRFAMPVPIFQRIAGVAGKDLPIMWRWLRSGSVPLDTTTTRELHPGALTVREWLERKMAPVAR
jgi:uncharacterized protein YbjT (DUF2867 family)